MRSSGLAAVFIFTPIDLISKSTEDALLIGRRLRAHGKSHCNTPLVVIPETVGKDVEGTDENMGANDWVCYYEDSYQLQ